MMENPASFTVAAGVDPPPPLAVRTDRLVCTLVAEELELIRGKLEELACALCTHPVIVSEFASLLQGVDEVAQRNENLARVLRARPMEPAIELITLESLKTRMLDAVTDALARAAEQGVGEGQAEGDWFSF